jgi:signal transduction histidine kinase
MAVNARLVALGERIRRGVRRHPRVVDAVGVLLLGLISLPREHGRNVDGTATGTAHWWFMAGLLLPLVWRRRAPIIAFAAVAFVALLQWNAHTLLPGDLALLVAFYSVAAYEPWRRVVAAAVVLEVGAVLAATRFAPPSARAWGWVFISGMVTAAGLLGWYVRTRRAYLAALVDRAERLERERDQQAQIAAQAERARIAREMHDVVAHHIAVMIALADGARYTRPVRPEQADELMEQVASSGRAALADMRRLLGVMRTGSAGDVEAPARAPQPVLADLEDLVSTLRTAGVATSLSVTGRPEDLPAIAQLAVFRLVQEALTNTLKHARATRAHVLVACHDDHVDLEITDDGTAGAAGAATAGGHGLVGMRERAAMFGGTVEAGPRPGAGWRVATNLRIAATAG